jgi:hypothetical protein
MSHENPKQLQARLFVPPYRVSDFAHFRARKTPGNVGLCLSGGGSRALVAGMGQLRALAYLQANGASLLSQIKAISTVSGGSWVGSTYQFLTGTSDAAYLNDYVPDPSRLVATKTEGHSLAETLDQLPEGNIGQVPANTLFAPELLAVQAVLLKLIGTPTSMIWQTLVGHHVLEPYGLYKARERRSGSLFSLDPEVLAQDVTGPNPSLAGEPVALYSADRPRAFLVCNFAMFVTLDGETGNYKYLVPVHSSPYYSTIVGAPKALDSNGQPPGGGGPTAFAFNSTLASCEAGAVAISQREQWALSDAIGTSSAFFALVLEDLFTSYEKDDSGFYAALATHADALTAWFKQKYPDLPKPIAEVLHLATELAAGRARLGAHLLGREIASIISELKDLVPQYDYWSALATKPVEAPKPSRFADGGDLENTGVGGMLAYGDIDNIITCVNSSDGLAPASLGVFDAQGREIPDTRIKISSQIPVLFGYQPYREDVGYRLYTDHDDGGPANRIFRFNQVFPSEQFAEVLRGLWAASGNAEGNTNARPAVYAQRLKVLDNDWFGVRGRDSEGRPREVTVVWVYNNYVSDWVKLLDKDVQALIAQCVKDESFPHYSTVRTHLSAQQVNALATLNAWVVANDAQASIFQALFKDAQDASRQPVPAQGGATEAA